MQINNDFTRHSKIADLGRWYVTQFVTTVAQELPKGHVILDAGAGECAYKRFFSHCEYIGVDLAVGDLAWNYYNLDCIGRLDHLPFAGASFDAVLSTQTLEHLDQPAASIQEFHRVLKPSGKLFLTAPMAHAEHQVPYDFFRYTSYGLKLLCSRAGFAEIQIMPFGGMFVRWAYEFPAILSIFPRARLARIALLPVKASIIVAIRILQMILLFLDRFDQRREYPFGWSLIAVKH